MRLLPLFILLPALALSCKEPGKHHADPSSLSASEVLTGMKNTLDKSKQLLHSLETTLRTFIIDLETQIEVDSQQLEQAIREAQGKCKVDHRKTEISGSANNVPSFTKPIPSITVPSTTSMAQVSTTTASTSTTTVKPTTTSRTPSCPLRPEVPSSEYPFMFVKNGSLKYYESQGYDWITCLFVVQMGAGTKSFTINGAYRCDVATKKWIHEDGREAPPFMSCSYPNDLFSSGDWCHINHEDSNGIARPISLIRGNEQYCAEGQKVQYADGMRIKNMYCQDYELRIDAENGTTIFEKINGVRTTLKCVPK